eukprot:6211944-Pleurochrysis_carterae.AAC.5
MQQRHARTHSKHTRVRAHVCTPRKRMARKHTRRWRVITCEWRAQAPPAYRCSEHAHTPTIAQVRLKQGLDAKGRTRDRRPLCGQRKHVQPNQISVHGRE